MCFWSISKAGQLVLKPKTEAWIPQFLFELTCLFGVVSATLLLGVDSIVGSFLAGLALNSSVPLASLLMKQIEFVGNSLFIWLFNFGGRTLQSQDLFYKT